MNPLAPAFLVNNIPLIGLVISVMILVIFDDFVMNKLVFPFSDFLKTKVFEKTKDVRHFKKRRFIPKYLSEFIATAIFIIYCYFGCVIFSEYFVVPILARMQNIILIVIITSFVVFSYILNRTSWRRKMYG